jgi:hypothetical protein
MALPLEQERSVNRAEGSRAHASACHVSVRTVSVTSSGSTIIWKWSPGNSLIVCTIPGAGRASFCCAPRPFHAPSTRLRVAVACSCIRSVTGP